MHAHKVRREVCSTVSEKKVILRQTVVTNTKRAGQDGLQPFEQLKEFENFIMS